ncbi:hypothetical protein [Paenibacillus gansuensis]|uniref:Uncharacterized protein n=1 Tax=Paenibacillus gansuensis TaxID=306542 RepID=A0ABW5PHP2_9BACL
MHQFFDPSLLPVTTTDLEGNILYVRTHGLFHYGYPDIIAEQGGEESEQLLLDILDRIFSMEFNINATWNYNGRIFRLEKGHDGLAHVVFPKLDEARIITIQNLETGQPAKYMTKGLMDLFGHPEAEIAGDTPYAKDILGYLMEQVKNGTVYDDDTTISYDQFLYGIVTTIDRLGFPVVVIRLETAATKQITITQNKRRRNSHLVRVK